MQGKVMIDREVVERALEALELASEGRASFESVDSPMAALRAALDAAPGACQYAQDVGMPEYNCKGRCQYALPPVSDLVSALRAILAVSERHDTPSFNVISDAARAALEAARAAKEPT